MKSLYGFWEYLCWSWSMANLAYILFMILGFCLGCYGLFNFKKYSKGVNLISLYVLFSTIWDIVNEASAYIHETNTLTYKILDLVEVVLLSAVLCLFIPKKYHHYIKWQSAIVVVIGIILGIVVVGLHEPGDYLAIVCNLHIISLCAFFFYKILDKIYEQKLESTPSFWIVSGILISQSTGFLVEGTMSLRAGNGDLADLWVVFHASILVMYLFFAYAFYITTKK